MRCLGSLHWRETGYYLSTVCFLSSKSLHRLSSWTHLTFSNGSELHQVDLSSGLTLKEHWAARHLFGTVSCCHLEMNYSSFYPWFEAFSNAHGRLLSVMCLSALVCSILQLTSLLLDRCKLVWMPQSLGCSWELSPMPPYFVYLNYSLPIQRLFTSYLND